MCCLPHSLLSSPLTVVFPAHCCLPYSLLSSPLTVVFPTHCCLPRSLLSSPLTVVFPTHCCLPHSRSPHTTMIIYILVLLFIQIVVADIKYEECKPSVNVDQITCNLRIIPCYVRFGIQLEWIGRPCYDVDGIRIPGSGGCQCKNTCDFGGCKRKCTQFNNRCSLTDGNGPCISQRRQLINNHCYYSV